jgi:hypothetical protein
MGANSAARIWCGPAIGIVEDGAGNIGWFEVAVLPFGLVGYRARSQRALNAQRNDLTPYQRVGDANSAKSPKGETELAALTRIMTHRLTSDAGDFPSPPVALLAAVPYLILCLA